MRDSEGEPILAIPPVVRLVVIGVQPLAVVIPIRVEQVRTTVRIARVIVRATAHRILSGLNLIWHHNALIPRAKYLYFLKVAGATLSEAVTADTLGAWILDSAARSRNRPHIRLLPVLS